MYSQPLVLYTTFLNPHGKGKKQMRMKNEKRKGRKNNCTIYKGRLISRKESWRDREREKERELEREGAERD